MNGSKRVAAVGAMVLGAALASCGGGGGGGGGGNGIPSTVTLTTEQDIAREITNLMTLFGDPAAVAGSMGSRGTAASGMRHLVASSAVGARQGVRAKQMSRQAETVNCGTGSYTVDEFLQVARNLPLFAVTPTMDYWVFVDSNCRFTEGTYSETTNGREEFGDNYNYAAYTAESPYYDYSLDGSGSTPYTFVRQDTGYTETVKTLGRSEYRDNGTSTESRDVVTLDYTEVSGGETFSVDIVAGKSGNPLISADNYVAGTFTVDGPLAYKSTGCRGGNLVLDTVDAMTSSSDEFGWFVNGGQLVITSGSTEVTLVFQADGGIQYDFGNNNSGEITRAELLAADDCLAF